MNNNKIIIFDTTLRDGELTPGVTMNLEEKVVIAQLLDEMGVDIIEVGYPGYGQKDFQEIYQTSQLITNSTICGLAASKPEEIIQVAQAIKPALKGRINIYTNVNNKKHQKQVLNTIKETVSFAKDYCYDLQWNAFDATRTELNFLCQTIEIAIESGANTITIADSLGVASPSSFSQLLKKIFKQVKNIDQAIIAVHCHNDLGYAEENSLVALNYGVRQVEVAINGLGARQGNTDLAKFVTKLSSQDQYSINLNTSLLPKASELVSKITSKFQ
ncbi:MAG: hypothetical protein WA999_19995 [Spirulinaceae cyanobacterium]